VTFQKYQKRSWTW